MVSVIDTQMISSDLLALLRCPETRPPLGIASAELTAKLEAKRVAGNLRDWSGKLVTEPIDGGLVREDGARFFLVRDGIPILIAEEVIVLPQA